MPDLDTLNQAFAELERRADSMATHTTVRPARPAGHRVLLVTASAVGVAAVATGTALLAGGSDHPGRAPAAGGSSPIAPSPETAPSSAAPASGGGSAGFSVPQTARDLEERFRRVLGDTATFTVTDTGHAVTLVVPSAPPAPSGGSAPSIPIGTAVPIGSGDPNGAAIVGVLTSADGVSGGYDIQIFQSTPGATARCDDPDSSTCDVRRLADGSSLATGREPLRNDAVTFQADLIRPDGVEFLMHVSNERDPKGAGPVLAAHPPISLDRMTAIVTSERW